jgi:hypothetical protein
MSALPSSESNQSSASPLPPPGERWRIDLHRRRALITAGRIDVRPSRLALVPPFAGFLLGAGSVAIIVLGVTGGSIPYLLLAFLLVVALILVPLSGITLVYALFGANVIFDRAKQSGTWQQGLLGMGIGTTELVPFWKIAAILVTEAGAPGGSAGRRTEEFAQWEAVVLKESGKILTVAGMTVPRRFAPYGAEPVQRLANAIGALTGAPVRLAANDAESGKAGRPATAGPAARLAPEPRRRSAGSRQTPQRKRS